MTRPGWIRQGECLYEFSSDLVDLSVERRWTIWCVYSHGKVLAIQDTPEAAMQAAEALLLSRCEQVVAELKAMKGKS